MNATVRRLDANGVGYQINRLTEFLSPVQIDRLKKLAALIDHDRLINFELAVETLFSTDAQTAQSAFRKFRNDVASSILDSGIALTLAVDSAKKSPPADRHCWFEGDDPAIAQLEAMSAEEIRDPYTAEKIVTSRAARVLSWENLRVYVDAVPADYNSTAFDDFERRLSTLLAVVSGTKVTVHSPRTAAQVGERTKDARRNRAVESDLILRLISPAYLSAEREDGDDDGPPTLDVLFAAVPRTASLPSQSSPVTGLGRSFSKLRGEDRDEFVVDVANRALAIFRADVSGPHRAVREDAMIAQLTRQGLAYQTPGDSTIEGARAAVFDLDNAALDFRSSRVLSDAFDVVERLASWALSEGPRSPSQCALLGDYGTGKTTTARALTQRILEQRRLDENVPLPLYFDLRMLSARQARDCGRLSEVFDALTSQMEGEYRLPTGAEVVAIIQNRPTVVIFDGLDEVLVHLDAWEGQKFTRMLWRAVRPATGGEAHGRLLITCRTHYFRSIREEADHFLGQDRTGPTSNHYLALLLLPFSEEQIRAYLTANLPGADVDELLTLMAGVHNLTELAQRPYTLRLIAGQLESIERARADGREFRSSDIYSNIVESWLSRDNGKHTLMRQHKKALMERLAAELWRAGRSSWQADELDQWFVDHFQEHPEMQGHYGSVDKPMDLLKEDLRTATFVSRGNDDGFRFAHTSLHEYFLACYLVRALVDSRTPSRLLECWDLAVPSPETLTFLAQVLEGLAEGERPIAMNSLDVLKGRAHPRASLLAFRFGAAAQASGYRSQSLAASNLDGLNLDGLEVEGTGPTPLDMRMVSLVGSRLRGATFRNVDLRDADLRGSDLTNATFVGCLIDGANVENAEFIGTSFVSCTLADVALDRAIAHRVKLVDTETSVELPLSGGWNKELDSLDDLDRRSVTGPRLDVFSGHSDAITAARFSPDGEIVLTTSLDHSARIWDAATGECLAALWGHVGPVTVGEFSNDGRWILTAGQDGVASVWSRDTFELRFSLSRRSGSITAGKFSPDDAWVATSDDAGLVIWNARSGEIRRDFTNQLGPVTSFQFSSDSMMLITTSDESQAEVWNVDGTHRATLQTYMGAVHNAGFAGEEFAYTVSSGGLIAFWRTDSWKPVEFSSGMVTMSNAFAVSDDGRMLFASAQGRGACWDTHSRSRVSQLLGLGDTVSSAKFSQDGESLAVAGALVARIWRLDSGQHVTTLKSNAPIRSIDLSADRALTVTDDDVTIWDLASGQRTVRFGTDVAAVAFAVADSTGSTIVTATTNGAVQLWATTGRLGPALQAHAGIPTCAAFSHRGDLVASGGSDGVVHISDSGSGVLRSTVRGGTNPVTAVAFDPTGRSLAIVSSDGTVRLVDSDLGREVRRLAARSASDLRSVAFSPDGKSLVIGDALMDTDGNRSLPLTGHSGTVTSSRFSPDGLRILTASADKTLCLWSAEDGSHLMTIAGHPAGIVSGDFSGDGDRLIAAGGRTVRIIDAYTGRQLESISIPGGDVMAAQFVDGISSLLTLSKDNRVRVRGYGSTPSTVEILFLPGGDMVALTRPEQVVVDSTAGAWRWLGNTVVAHGKSWRLPVSPPRRSRLEATS